MNLLPKLFKIALFISLLLLMMGAAKAQIGVTGLYQTGEFTELTEDRGKLNGYGAGIHYTRPLLDNRIAIAPELLYVQLKGNDALSNESGALQLSGIQLKIPFRFYFINFLKDCDCPTFRRKNGKVNSKLYFEIGPGLSYRSMETELDEGDWNTAFMLHLGLGIHLDLFDPLRLTPFVGLDYGFSGEQSDSDDVPFDVAEQSEGIFLRVGMHFSLIP